MKFKYNFFPLQLAWVDFQGVVSTYYGIIYIVIFLTNFLQEDAHLSRSKYAVCRDAQRCCELLAAVTGTEVKVV